MIEKTVQTAKQIVKEMVDSASALVCWLDVRQWEGSWTCVLARVGRNLPWRLDNRLLDLDQGAHGFELCVILTA